MMLLKGFNKFQDVNGVSYRSDSEKILGSQRALQSFEGCFRKGTKAFQSVSVSFRAKSFPVVSG